MYALNMPFEHSPSAPADVPDHVSISPNICIMLNGYLQFSGVNLRVLLLCRKVFWEVVILATIFLALNCRFNNATVKSTDSFSIAFTLRIT